MRRLKASPASHLPCHPGHVVVRSSLPPFCRCLLVPVRSEKLSLSGQMPESMTPMTMSSPAVPTPPSCAQRPPGASSPRNVGVLDVSASRSSSFVTATTPGDAPQRLRLRLGELRGEAVERVAIVVDLAAADAAAAPSRAGRPGSRRSRSRSGLFGIDFLAAVRLGRRKSGHAARVRRPPGIPRVERCRDCWSGGSAPPPGESCAA